MTNFFNAAGCTTFTLPRLKTQSTTQYLENERHYAKDRSVYQIRTDFPNPIDIDGLTQYLEETIKDENIRDCMNHFGISSALEDNKKLLAKALAMQFQRFIEANVDDIDNVIPAEYEALLNGNDVYAVRVGALYPRDDFWVEERNQKHDVNCYEKFQNTWVIHNSGSVYWSGIKIVLKEINKNSYEL